MRLIPLLPISLVTTLILVQAVSGATIPITQMPALYVSDYGAGVFHPINSYTLQIDRDISNGAWMLLGTNDQVTFARIDARKDIAFIAGGAEQFNVANSGAFRWYYLYLQDGFPVGSSVEFHLHEITPAPPPTPSGTPGIEIVIERAPLVVIVDFDGRATKVDQYNLTSSVNLPGGQSWQLLGTNDPDMLGSDDPGLFTLLDDRSGIGFTSGVPEQFAVTSPGSFLYYVFYFRSGFSVTGTNLAIHLSETPVTPTPTPGGVPPPITPVPTPTTVPPSSAGFEGNPRAGYVPLLVTFTDMTSNAPSSWSWDFGDGQTSSMQSPVHVYTTPGVYTVNLTTCNDAGCSWVARPDYIYVIPSGPPPTVTPRYYIKIGTESAGTKPASEEVKATTESSESGSSSGSGSSGSGSSGSGGSGSGSSGSGGEQGSSGTGGMTGQESQIPSQGVSQSIPIGIILTLVEALGNVVTATEDLLSYLQTQLFSLFGW